MPRAGIMFSLTRGLAPFRESEKCLHNTLATLLRKTFSTWRPTATLTPAQTAAKPALPLTTTKAAFATFATTKSSSFTGFGTGLTQNRTGFNFTTGQGVRCSTWNKPGHDSACLRPGPSDHLVAWQFWRGRASSSATTICFGGTCAIISARPKNVKSFLRVRTKFF